MGTSNTTCLQRKIMQHVEKAFIVAIQPPLPPKPRLNSRLKLSLRVVDKGSNVEEEK
ncbi:hypothetical protein Scep_025577 [Stephania cephalantha]|uniref:Uncharacterized protein n=1 Tax=Stephania cephalantha TaxID=152367 RepID=A0AAP0HMF5_9MAGN